MRARELALLVPALVPVTVAPVDLVLAEAVGGGVALEQAEALVLEAPMEPAGVVRVPVEAARVEGLALASPEPLVLAEALALAGMLLAKALVSAEVLAAVLPVEALGPARRPALAEALAPLSDRPRAAPLVLVVALLVAAVSLVITRIRVDALERVLPAEALLRG